MSTLNIERDESQVHYLTTPGAFGLRRHVEMGQSGSVGRFGVLRFVDDRSRITFKADAGPFQLFCGLAIDEARMLASALNTACDETEASAVPGDAP